MPAESLARYLRELDAGDVRSAVHYEGDDYETVYQRDDLSEEYTEAEFEEIAKHFVLKGFDDPLEQPEFARFGHLDATVRWFHEVVVVQVPLDEWTGVIVSLDRDTIEDTGTLIDALLQFVDENFADHGDTVDDPDELAEEFD
ncbi:MULTISPECIES: hypothetical protein [Halobacterium]|uniref:DUF7522 family protein n=1 Tax=Halobacterium TaxID=2239 RepID=UPI00073E4CFD|nr:MULTISPECIES: hypothetical protein [Halobacterium]MCG1002654.1 hypothetical protein [Halobacterium noricense]